MVSTRRTAREEPAAGMTAPDDLSNSLRKKPVQKATAAKKTEAEVKPKAARGRKAVVAAPEQSAQADVHEAPVSTLPAKATRKPVGRPRKDASAQAVEEPAPVQAKTAPKATRATASSRAKKADVRADESVDDLAAEQEVKPTRTRRAAAGTKAQPLSPKKITQVSKPQTRNAKSTGKKGATKAAPAKSTVSDRGARRTRAVSDENADVPSLPPAMNEDEDDIMLVSSTPVKRASPTKPPIHTEESAASEASMSSRPTTPSHSPVPSFDCMQDEYEYRSPRKHDDLASEASELEAEGNNATTASDDDELCGPKTPMRRASSGAEARYRASVQRTIRRENQNATETQTPVPNSVPRARKVGTSKTASPHGRSVIPPSENRPSTVARGGESSLTVRPLPDRESVYAEHQDDVEASPSYDKSVASEYGPESPIAVSGSLEHSTAADDFDAVFADDSAAETASQGVGEEAADPDETIFIPEEEEQVDPPDVHLGASFDTEDTVLVTPYDGDEITEISTQAESDEEDGEDEDGAATVLMHSPTPETLIWENIRQDVTIPVDFDAHLAGARTLPQAEATERLSIAANFVHATPDELDVVQGAEEGEGLVMAEKESENELDVFPVQAAADSTINLNDFIDFGALAEPTQRLELPAYDGPVSAEPAATTSEAESAAPTDLEPEGPAEDTAEKEVLVEEHCDEPVVSHLSLAEPSHEEDVPHYALPTLAFDARRKSLPAFSVRTPVKAGSRPNTSDGASMPRMVNAFGEPWWIRAKGDAIAVAPRKTHGRQRASTVASQSSARKAATATCDTLSTVTTPIATPKQRLAKLGAKTATPLRFRTPVTIPLRRPATVQKFSADIQTPRIATLRAQKAELDAAATPVPATPAEPAESTPKPIETPSERYPRLQPRQNYQEHANTVIAPSRFRTPTQPAVKRPRTAQKASASAMTPRASTLRPRPERSIPATATPRPATPATPREPSSTPEAAPETPSDRFPRLAPRSDYVQHAKTVTAPRFQSPARTPLKRPATVQKPSSLRKAILKNSTTMASHTPMKTPLKPPMMTPGQPPMTPHPAAPLRSVLALVEVYTLEGASASAPFVTLLHRLGAKTMKSWNERVTHVIFKDGSPTTLQRVRLHNKGLDESDAGNGEVVHCVNSRWVSDCDAEGMRMDEADDKYAVDVSEVPRGGRRRRKSMEPSALVNLGGNIVRERKSSLGRGSLGRSPMKFAESPVRKDDELTVAMQTPEVHVEDKENEPSSPVTPAYLAAPEKLIQQTAPINRMRKLGSKTRDAAKNRRLTYFNGAA